MSKCVISVVLPRLLKERGMTQSQLAKRSGVSLSTISTWLLPNSKPRVEAAFKVAQILVVTLDELLFDKRTLGPALSLDSLNLEPVLDGLYRLTLQKVTLPKTNREDD